MCHGSTPRPLDVDPGRPAASGGEVGDNTSDDTDDDAGDNTSDTPQTVDRGSDAKPAQGPRLQLKEGKKISGSSLQSPHDPDATYGHKGKGYEVQLAETCEESTVMASSRLSPSRGKPLGEPSLSTTDDAGRSSVQTS